MIKPGKFYNLSNFAYHYGIGKDWLSKSRLSRILKSPRYFKHHEDHPEELDVFDKEAVKFNNGTAFHLWFLEPDKFLTDVAIIPEFSGKGSQAARNEWKEKIRMSGQVPITKATHDAILACDEALNSGSYETARKIIQNPDNFTEKSGFWIDDETGLQLKCRPDIIAPDTVIWDLKTFNSYRPFENVAIDLHYDLQAYMTLEGVTAITGIPHRRFGFIIFHTAEEPYDIEVRMVDEQFILSGQEKFNKAISIYMDCMETGEWPGSPDVVQELSVSVWRQRQLEEIYFD